MSRIQTTGHKRAQTHKEKPEVSTWGGAASSCMPTRMTVQHLDYLSGSCRRL